MVEGATPVAGKDRFTIALAGNPNSGKTTIFNSLTGARQHVGNYPGVTVEKKTGVFTHKGRRIEVVDLPGTYSLTAYSLDERVARNFVVDERPDMVVDVIDSSNLERNLYLAVQFMELGIPVLLCLNMSDELDASGRRLDVELFSKLIGCPVVRTVGHRSEGIDELKDAIVALHANPSTGEGIRIDYGKDLEPHVRSLAEKVSALPAPVDRLPSRWVALKLLEQDAEIEKLVRGAAGPAGGILDEVSGDVKRIVRLDGDPPEAIIPERRYGHLAGICRESLRTPSSVEARLTFSDKLDNFLIHRLAGPLVLLVILFGVYQFTFLAAEQPAEWLGIGFEELGGWVNSLFGENPAGGMEMLRSLLVDGVIGGVGGVLGFLPMVVFLFVAVAIIEDSGYMARIAFVLDRVLRSFGLHGKSVLALIVSGGLPGGCAVPGVMATRVMRSRRDRIATIMVAPMLMCGAKVPVIMLISAAFFKGTEAWMMFLFTLLAWAMVMLAGLLLKGTVLRGPREPFVMELPPYRMPTVGGVIRHTWDRAWMYIKKAGTVIVAVSVVLWALMYFPRLSDEQLATAANEEVAAQMQLEHSFAGRMGLAIEPATRLFGQNWRTNVALVGGFAAKEVVVSTLGTAYSLGEVDPDDAGPLVEKIQSEKDWSPLSAFALGFFVLIYAPCFVTVVAIGREIGWKWAAFSILYTTVIAYALSVGIFQVGLLFM